MTESISEGNSLPKLSRRDLFRFGTAASVGMVAGAVAGHEVLKLDNGINTENATFVPLYEGHFNRINETQIPSDTDILSVELASDTNRFSPSQILLVKMGPSTRFLPDEILALASKEKIELMFADLSVPESPKPLNQARLVEQLSSLAFFTYTIIDNKNRRKQSLPRRTFLKWAAGGFVAWAYSKEIFTAPAMAASFQDDLTIRRIFSRIGAINHHLHPEDTILFFRDLVIADKLLEAGGEFKQRTGKKPKIAVWIGASHSGIEDFLIAGQDFCRTLISAYPNFFLKEAIDANNGPENFSSVRIFSLPPGIKINDEKMEEKMEMVKERQITDSKLLSELRSL